MANWSDFVNRRQPDWKLPLIQIVLDWVAGLTFILEIFAGCIFLARKSLVHSIPPPVTFLASLVRQKTIMR